MSKSVRFVCLLNPSVIICRWHMLKFVLTEELLHATTFDLWTFDMIISEHKQPDCQMYSYCKTPNKRLALCPCFIINVKKFLNESRMFCFILKAQIIALRHMCRGKRVRLIRDKLLNQDGFVLLSQSRDCQFSFESLTTGNKLVPLQFSNWAHP